MIDLPLPSEWQIMIQLDPRKNLIFCISKKLSVGDSDNAAALRTTFSRAKN
jgi:hypothetical protein